MEEELITISIKRKDNKTLEGFKDHPRQPMHEVITEITKIASLSKQEI